MTSAQGHSSKKTLKVNQTQACWTSDHAILYALPYSFFLRVSTHFLFTFFPWLLYAMSKSTSVLSACGRKQSFFPIRWPGMVPNPDAMVGEEVQYSD